MISHAKYIIVVEGKLYKIARRQTGGLEAHPIYWVMCTTRNQGHADILLCALRGTTDATK